RLEGDGISRLRYTFPPGRYPAGTVRRSGAAHPPAVDGREGVFCRQTLPAGQRLVRAETGPAAAQAVGRRGGREKTVAHRGLARGRVEHAVRAPPAGGEEETGSATAALRRRRPRLRQNRKVALHCRVRRRA